MGTDTSSIVDSCAEHDFRNWKISNIVKDPVEVSPNVYDCVQYK